MKRDDGRVTTRRQWAGVVKAVSMCRQWAVGDSAEPCLDEPALVKESRIIASDSRQEIARDRA